MMTPEDQRRHRRVYKTRGKARDQLCVRCAEDGVEKQAAEWATLHTEDGWDPWADYVALCKRCHGLYDNTVTAAERAARLTSEGRAKISAANRGRKLSPELKAKISAAAQARTFQPLSEEHKANIGKSLRGKPKSDAHRAKLSEAAKAWRAKKREG
jgi:hypothetical protein